MDGSQPKLGMLAVFAPDADLESLRLRLAEAGIPKRHISVLSSLPLGSRSQQAVHPWWPYGMTIAAGLVGIGAGVFFAAGTAAMYPLMTGGKPIVAAPIVGIISYETMMLLAIVVTFLTMIVRMRRGRRWTVDREPRIDGGRLALSVVLVDDGQEANVRRLLETAGAEDIRLVSRDVPRPLGRKPSHALPAFTLLVCVAGGCSPDMQEQPSYRSQESPRLHSPPGSIPRHSRALVSAEAFSNGALPDQAKALYRINCLPCHGHSGEGTGPVAPYLHESPANLLAPKIRALSREQLYDVITNGKDMMPSFRGELSATERMIIAAYVQAMKPDGPPRQPQRPSVP